MHKKAFKFKQKVDPVGSEVDIANSFQRDYVTEDNDLNDVVNAAAAATTSYMNEQDRQAHIAKLREEYEKRRKSNKTQTILTSGLGASGSPTTSSATLLGGR